MTQGCTCGHVARCHGRYQVTQFGHTAGHGSPLPPGSLDRGAHGVPAHPGVGHTPPYSKKGSLGSLAWVPKARGVRHVSCRPALAGRPR